jgi:2,5-diamino-6-(ribosylamino)-4(3H)-pyrimidinone 5'-phosphate reductase
MPRPKVILNFAMSLDGKVSTTGNAPSGFTSAHDKKRLLEIRSLGDALLVGRNTLMIDNMSMGLPDETLQEERRARGQAPYPIRVIVTSSGQLPTNLKIFEQDFSPIVIYTTRRMPPETQSWLETRGSVHLFDDLAIDQVLIDLSETYDIRTLVCEGGPTLARTLAEADAIDELFLTIAPPLFGGFDAPGILGHPGSFLPSSLKYRLVSMEIVANECYLHYARSR